MKIAILCGTVRVNRDGNRVAKFAKKLIESRGWEAVVIDPAEYQLPLLDKVYKQMENPEEKFRIIHEHLISADGFLILAAEYNHSIPPALKNLLDHFREEYFFKPSAIISYSSGPFAGVRAGEHVKLICSELKTPAIPTTLPISKVHDSILEDGSSLNGDYERRAVKFLDEFAWYLEAFKAQRLKGTPY